MIAYFTTKEEFQVLCVIDSIVFRDNKIMVASQSSGYWEIEFNQSNECFKGHTISPDDDSEVASRSFYAIQNEIREGKEFIDIDSIIGHQYTLVIKRRLGLND